MRAYCLQTITISFAVDKLAGSFPTSALCENAHTAQQILPKPCLKSPRDTIPCVGTNTPEKAIGIPKSGQKAQATSFIENESSCLRNLDLPVFKGTDNDGRKCVHIRVEEDEESEKDEISSALYIPHTAPSLRGSSLTTDELGPSHQEQDTLEDESSNFTSDNEGSAVEAKGCKRKLKEGLPDLDAIGPSGDEASDYTTDALTCTSASESEDFSDQERWENESLPHIESDGETTHIDDLDFPTCLGAFKKEPSSEPSSDRRRADRRSSKYYHAHTPAAPQVPLGAVELKPYNHQVGGHTALFRFSRRAVCKSLSNRENEFYEAIETRHPSLLRFLPR